MKIFFAIQVSYGSFSLSGKYTVTLRKAFSTLELAERNQGKSVKNFIDNMDKMYREGKSYIDVNPETVKSQIVDFEIAE